jgi:hypothetical protein
MFTFVYHPKANRETLREFNARVQEFCAENPVVNIEALHIGDNLMLQGSTADDMDVDGVPTLTAVVRTIDQDDADLEEQLDGLIQQALQSHNEDPEKGDPNVPVKFLVISADKRAWVVMLCVNGVAEDGDDDKGEEPAAPTDPSLGFAG